MGYTHGGAEAGAGTGKRYSGYDEKGHRRHRKEYIGTETYVPAGSRRGSTYEARERAPSRHQSVYEGRETAVVGGGRRGSVYEGRERSRGRREDTYESVEKTARPVRPERVVYRD